MWKTKKLEQRGSDEGEYLDEKDNLMKKGTQVLCMQAIMCIKL